MRIYEYSIFTLSAVAGSMASSRPYQGLYLIVFSQFIPILTGGGVGSLVLRSISYSCGEVGPL